MVISKGIGMVVRRREPSVIQHLSLLAFGDDDSNKEDADPALGGDGNGGLGSARNDEEFDSRNSGLGWILISLTQRRKRSRLRGAYSDPCSGCRV